MNFNMTENQLAYQLNCRRSKALCLLMEQLVQQADYEEKMMNYYSRELTVNEFNGIRLQLDELWDRQIDLFFEIQDEYKMLVFKTPAARKEYSFIKPADTYKE